MCTQLCITVEPTAIGEALNEVDEGDYGYFYVKYLHDFVRLAHRCKHKNQEDQKKEYEVIWSCVMCVRCFDVWVNG